LLAGLVRQFPASGDHLTRTSGEFGTSGRSVASQLLYSCFRGKFVEAGLMPLLEVRQQSPKIVHPARQLLVAIRRGTGGQALGRIRRRVEVNCQRRECGSGCWLERGGV